MDVLTSDITLSFFAFLALFTGIGIYAASREQAAVVVILAAVITLMSLGLYASAQSIVMIGAMCVLVVAGAAMPGILAGFVVHGGGRGLVPAAATAPAAAPAREE